MKKIPWNEIDPGIRPVVRLLNNRGIETLQSCEGHKVIGGRCLVFPHLPWVELTRKSFYRNLTLLKKLLNPIDKRHGKICLGSLDKKYNFHFKRWQYHVVFYNNDCLRYFANLLGELE